MEIVIREAEHLDIDDLTLYFIDNLRRHPEYISHGEIQMGVGVASYDQSGIFKGEPSPEAELMWRRYITEKVSSADAVVYIAEDGDKRWLGFTVVDIEEDGASPFGMICDLLVFPENRTAGVGTELLKHGMAWLRNRGVEDVYLESGKDNHAAHHYFEHRGFEHVSNIYKLKVSL